MLGKSEFLLDVEKSKTILYLFCILFAKCFTNQIYYYVTNDFKAIIRHSEFAASLLCKFQTN